jgi:Zn-dependent protease with chaperone function
VSGAVAASSPQHLNSNHLFGLTAGLILAVLVLGVLLTRAVGVRRDRAYHRRVLDLIADKSDGGDVFVIDDPRSAAYTLPGHHGRVVVSSGAVATLSSDELTVVLAHERAHVIGRHDLVLFPFETLASTVPRSRSLAAVREHVGTLLEMAADDAALRMADPCTFIRAICKLSTTGTDEPTIDATSTAISQRAMRAINSQRGARLVALGSGLSSLAVVVLPLAAIVAFNRAG